MSKMSHAFHTEESRVVATIPVGIRPVGVGVDVHNQVFASNSGNNTVSVIKSSTNTVTKVINVGFGPESVATDPQFGVYVANHGGNAVSVIDRFNTVVTTLFIGGPSHPPPNTVRVAVDHIMSRAYVTNRAGHRVSIIRTSSNPPVIAPEFIDVPNPLGVAVDPVDHRVYVTQPDSGTVSVADPATGDVVRTIPVRHQPLDMAIDSHKRRVYVANSGSNTVSVIDIASGGVHDVDVQAHPISVAIASRGDAYVSHSDGTVKVIDAESISVSATIPVGARPAGLAFEPHSNRVYVANSGDGTLSVIDTAGG